jgi:hypothetical protein
LMTFPQRTIQAVNSSGVPPTGSRPRPIMRSLTLSGYGRNSPTPRVRGAQACTCSSSTLRNLVGLDQFLDEITALIARCKASPVAQGNMGRQAGRAAPRGSSR